MVDQIQVLLTGVIYKIMENRFKVKPEEVGKEKTDLKLQLTLPSNFSETQTKNLGVLKGIEKTLKSDTKLKKIIALLGRLKDKDFIGELPKNLTEIKAFLEGLDKSIKELSNSSVRAKIEEIIKPEWWEGVNLSLVETYLSEIVSKIDALAPEPMDMKAHEEKEKSKADSFAKDFKKLLSTIEAVGGGPFDAAIKNYVENLNLNNSSNYHSTVSAAPTAPGKYVWSGSLASTTDQVLVAETPGRTVIVKGIVFSNSYTAEKVPKLYFGDVSTNRDTIFWHNLGKDGGGIGMNLVNSPIAGQPGWGLFLDNDTGATLYFTILFEII